MNDIFLEEYNSNDAILKYSKETAGWGIDYLLEHDYGRIYLEVLLKHLPESARREGVRILEFGCGAGMNVLHMISLLERNKIGLKEAVGTDFSKKLIEAASLAADRGLSPANRSRTQFLWGRNESLLEDLASQLRVDESSLLGSFDMIFGVNTIRYCHRMGKEVECATGIRRLLRKGGVCVVIDMNQKFPLFRSRFKDKRTLKKEDYYLPSLTEYSRPFEQAGYRLIRKENFCWIPHSAGPMLAGICRAASPVLDRLFPGHAMRCLVVAQNPG
jgi:SAM-dependent methyltransferase